MLPTESSTSLIYSGVRARVPLSRRVAVGAATAAALLLFGAPTRAKTQHSQPASAPTLVPIQPELFSAGGALTNAFADFDKDGDGDLDLFVALRDKPNMMFRNDGGHFSDIADSLGMAWGGRAPHVSTNGTVRPCAADVNNDGVIDLFTANYGPNGLFLGRTTGAFDDVSRAWGVRLDGHYDTCAFADIDNDGKLDFYVNGTVSATESFRDYIYHQTTNHYADITPSNIIVLQSSHGAQWADVDADGALDLALAGSRADATHALLHNTLPPLAARRSLRIRVVDAHGHATRAGAEVRIYATGTNRLLGMRLVDTGSGYDSQSDIPVHFGLASMAQVDIEVTVPANGKRTTTRTRRVSPGSWVGKVMTVRG